MSDFNLSAGEQLKQQILLGKSILIVDDDPIFRRITRAFLESQGCEIEEAENGLDGLKQLKDNNFDLVVCDLAMPVLNGIEFVEEMSLSYPSLPLMVVSATEAMSDVAQALKYGIKDFVAKPIQDYAQLTSTISNILEDSISHQADVRDFASQWFRVEEGEVPEEQELHWHLDYLQNNPSAARDLLQAMMPENDTAQGDWRFSYRLLQSADVMPLVFDYAWLIEGQFAFYIVDSGSHGTDGVGSSLLLRALFHDYIRNLKTSFLDLKDLAEIIEKGVGCADCSGSVSAMLGVVDTVTGTLSILPAGLDGQWRGQGATLSIKGGAQLGDNCMRNFITKDLPVGNNSQVVVNNLGVCSFSLDIVKKSVV